jgi:hypothetical protein
MIRLRLLIILVTSAPRLLLIPATLTDLVLQSAPCQSSPFLHTAEEFRKLPVALSAVVQLVLTLVTLGAQQEPRSLLAVVILVTSAVDRHPLLSLATPVILEARVGLRPLPAVAILAILVVCKPQLATLGISGAQVELRLLLTVVVLVILVGRLPLPLLSVAILVTLEPELGLCLLSAVVNLVTSAVD